MNKLARQVLYLALAAILGPYILFFSFVIGLSITAPIVDYLFPTALNPPTFSEIGYLIFFMLFLCISFFIGLYIVGTTLTISYGTTALALKITLMSVDE